MAQVYTFTDANGEIRLMAEINPAPGGSLPFTLLGPYTIAHDTPGISDDYTPLPGSPVLAVGTVVFKVLDFVTVDWVGEGANLQIGLRNPGDDMTTIWIAHTTPQSSNHPTTNDVAFYELGTVAGAGIVREAGTQLAAYSPNGPASAGSSDIYALVSVPT